MIGIAGNMPLVLVWLVGLIMACVKWRTQRKASVLCLSSMLILLVWLVAYTGLTLALPFLLPLWQINLAPGWAYALLNAIGNLITALCYALLLWAIFTGRSSQRST
jgi:hypothetical protein